MLSAVLNLGGRARGKQLILQLFYILRAPALILIIFIGEQGGTEYFILLKQYCSFVIIIS